MAKSEHLQFMALMLPTLLVVALAAVSLADPDAEPIAHQPAIEVTIPHASVDGQGRETAY